jgi:hypothetical protein
MLRVVLNLSSLNDRFIDWVLEHPDPNDPDANRLDIVADYMDLFDAACSKLGIVVDDVSVQKDLRVWSLLLAEFEREHGE